LKRVKSLALNERILVEFYDRTENPKLKKKLKKKGRNLYL